MLKGSRNKVIVAFVSNSCWSLYNFRIDVIRQFMQDGMDVLLVAPRDEHTAKLLSSTSKVGTSMVGKLIYREIDCRNSAVDPIKDWKLYTSLLRIYKEEKPDMIFHYVTKPVIFGSLAAGRLHIPSVALITGLGYVYAKGGILSKVVSYLFRWSLTNAKKVWFLNQENALFFERKSIVPKQKIQVLPGEGIHTERFKPAGEVDTRIFTFIMISRLLWSKGVGIYAEAANHLLSKGIQARFLLLGKAERIHPDNVSFEQVQKWQNSGLLEYLGESDDVPDYLSKADCFVLPTYYEEGAPRSIMEAASMELPVIASRHVGCNLLVDDGSNGFLCNPKDPQDLALKMEKMIHLSAEDRRTMGKKGREKMKTSFDKDIVIQIYQDTVRGFLSE